MSSGAKIIMETPRLILRPWKKNKADAKALYRLAKDVRIGPAAGWGVHKDPAHSLQIIREILSTAEIYAVFLRELPAGEHGEAMTDRRFPGRQVQKQADIKTLQAQRRRPERDAIPEGTDQHALSMRRGSSTQGCLVGAAGITYAGTGRKWLGKHEAEIGYWIGVPYWGRGYAPEAVGALLRRAFGELGMEKVWCGYYDGNEQSRRVQEKCGFVYDHTDWHAFNEELGEEKVEHFCMLTKSRYEAL